MPRLKGTYTKEMRARCAPHNPRKSAISAAAKETERMARDRLRMDHLAIVLCNPAYARKFRVDADIVRGLGPDMLNMLRKRYKKLDR